MQVYFTENVGRKFKYSSWRPLIAGVRFIWGPLVKKKKKECQMYVYSVHALSYTKLVHRHATQTKGNKYFK